MSRKGQLSAPLWIWLGIIFALIGFAFLLFVIVLPGQRTLQAGVEINKPDNAAGLNYVHSQSNTMLEKFYSSGIVMKHAV